MPAKIVELIDVQMLNGQQVLTRMHYLDADGVASEDQLVSDYINDVVPAMASFQSARLTHVAIRHRQVFPVDTLTQERAITPVVVGGESGGVDMPSYASFSFKLNIGATVWVGPPQTGHIKRGGKHIAGVVEGAVSGDSIVGSGIITACAAWITAALDPGSDNWVWVVATFQDRPKHRVPTVQGYSIVAGATPPSPGTQNTRKVLRGRTY